MSNELTGLAQHVLSVVTASPDQAIQHSLILQTQGSSLTLPKQAGNSNLSIHLFVSHQLEGHS